MTPKGSSGRRGRKDSANDDKVTADEVRSDDTVAEELAGDEPGEVEAGAVAARRAGKTTPKEQRDGFTHRLYTGETGFDFIGRRRIFYLITLVMILGSIALVVFRGLNFGIDFVGGNTFEVPAQSSQMSQAEDVVQGQLDTHNAEVRAENPDADQAQIASVQSVGSGAGTSILIKTTEVDGDTAQAITAALAQEFRPQIEERLTAAGTEVTDATVLAQVSNQAIDATWGGDVSRKALIALAFFLVIVSIFLRIRYRGGLAVGALASMFHDIILSIGIYALVGFEVTPATVIGLLTILAFSIYDTVVVFDKVDENTRPLLAGSRMTYSEAANLAINQTLMRSINTSVISLLPVAALLFVGAGLLGAGTLKDLALIMLVGMATGAYSSVFLAAPIAADLAERRPEYQELAKRVTARRAAGKDQHLIPGRKRGERVTAVVGAGTESERPRKPVGTTPKPGAKPQQRKGRR